jgi:hypothetical protein
MNTTHYKSPGRRADLSPFGVNTAETPTSALRVRNAVGGDIRKGEAVTDAGTVALTGIRTGVGRTGPEQQIEEPQTAGRRLHSVSSNRRFHER